MKFVENFIATELNISLDNLETVNLKKNFDGLYILSSNALNGVYLLKYSFDIDTNTDFFDVYNYGDETKGVRKLDHLDEMVLTFDFEELADDVINDEDLTESKEILKNICNYIRENLES